MRGFPRWPLLMLLALGLCFGVAQVRAGDHDFVGSKKCKACHLKQYKSWETTTMATTFGTLSPGERAEANARLGRASLARVGYEEALSLGEQVHDLPPS